MPAIRDYIKFPPPPNFKKMLMPIRGLRDLQFTVNYFNQIIDPLLLGAQPFTLGNGGFYVEYGWV